MKTKLSRIFGVAVTVAVLASMLVVALPASAGTLAWGSESTLPTGGVSVLDMAVAGNGTTIYAVVTGDYSSVGGTTANGYSDLTFGTADHTQAAATTVAGGVPDSSILGDQRLIKSTNGGAAWSAVNTNPPGMWTSTMDAVAVPSDSTDGSYVVVVQTDNATTPGNKQMSVSTDGGASWASVVLASVTGGAIVGNTTITGLDVSKAVNGGRTIAIATDTSVWTFAQGGLGGFWTNITAAYPANQTPGGVLGVQFSPNFASDGAIVVLTNTSNVSATPVMQLFNNVAHVWNNVSYPGWGTGVVVVSPAAVAPTTAVTSATLALSPTFAAFDATSISYVGVVRASASDTGNGLYRLNGAFVGAQLAGAGNQIKSVALSAAGDKLVAGSFADNGVVRVASPATATGVIPAHKKPAVSVAAVCNNTIVAYAGSTVVAATQGADGAFSKSTDDGNNFIDISLVRGSGSNAGFAVSADGSKMYMITVDTTNHVLSLFRKATAWERTATQVSNAAQFAVDVAPDNGDVVYVSEISGAAAPIYYTNDGGYTTWTYGYSPNPVVDIAVTSATTAYVLTTGGVSTSTSGALSWSAPTPLPAGMSVDSIGVVTGGLIVGGANGEVAYSTDNNSSWTKVGANIPVLGSVLATADKLSTGGIIYAVSTTNTGFVYRFTIGTSTSWAPMMQTTLFSGGPAGITNSSTPLPSVATGIAYSSGALYVSTAVTSTPGNASSALYRTLTPGTAALDTDWSVIKTAQEVTTPSLTNSWGAYDLVLTVPPASGISQGLAVTVGADKNPKLWSLSVSQGTSYPNGFNTGMLQANRNALESFTDILVTASPALNAPVERATVQINTANGAANNVVLMWNAVAGAPVTATYQVQVALDSAFTQPVTFTNNPAYTATGIVGTLLIVGPSGTAQFPFQANTTYYWRVRIDAPVYSTWSAGRSFVIAPLQPIAIQSPANGANNVPVNPTFVWNPVVGATTYELVVSDDPTFKIITFSRTSTQPVFATDEALAYGTVYYWRVRASAPATAVTDWVTGVFTTVGKPVVTTPASTGPVITITQPAPTTITVEVPPTVSAIPAYLLWIIIGIGAILVIALIVLIVRTRRVS